MDIKVILATLAVGAGAFTTLGAVLGAELRYRRLVRKRKEGFHDWRMGRYKKGARKR
jgi:hypothetical protein